MLPKRSNIRFAHKCDIYTKSTVTNDVGQKFPTWTLATQGQVCFFTPAGSTTTIRISPTMEEGDFYNLILPHDADIDYGSRVQNITRFGEVVSSDTYQVVQIDKQMSFSGKVQYLNLRIKSVIE